MPTPSSEQASKTNTVCVVAPYTQQELTKFLKPPVTPPSKLDLRRIPFPTVLVAEEDWRNTFAGLLFEQRCFWPEEVIESVVKGCWEHFYPERPYRKANRFATIPMILSAAIIAAGDHTSGILSWEAAERWRDFPYETVTLESNRDRHRYENLGLLPGEPDPVDDEPEEDDAMTPTPNSEKDTATTTVTPAKKIAGKKGGKAKGKSGGGKKSAAAKARTPKKAAKQHPAKAKEDKKLPGVPDAEVSRSADGVLYDCRMGRPGTYRAVICKACSAANGATRDQCVEAGIKAGLYKDSESGRAAAEYQWSMHRNALQREATSERRMKWECVDADTKRWKLTVR